jgi:hypothetical protein
MIETNTMSPNINLEGKILTEIVCDKLDCIWHYSQNIGNNRNENN